GGIASTGNAPSGVTYPMGFHISRSASVKAQFVIGYHGSGTGGAHFRSKASSTENDWTPWYKLWSSQDFSGVTNTTISNWNTAYGWGNHAGLYMPLGANIPASADLNTYITTGIYRQTTNSNAASGTNYPEA